MVYNVYTIFFSSKYILTLIKKKIRRIEKKWRFFYEKTIFENFCFDFDVFSLYQYYFSHSRLLPLDSWGFLHQETGYQILLDYLYESYSTLKMQNPKSH